ncbi:related to dCMP deaminase [Ramularia collo-cygni]|uniref:Deoxycytidylate deaminase n=1 Tax=Ramularia collo-cygni TaxID=112498 RepID=A0A2D3UNM3_9PEZI|nr:related to dCMP deaminase [Ramularia collo-cygni]CZT14045.1 related to dCMP deaminase [Ramularia collo-cygni]
MLIGICGGICAGKNSILDYLVSNHAFQVLSLTSKSDLEAGESTSTSIQFFPTIDALLHHATQNWQQNFATTSIHSESIAEKLSTRPFFILLHIDAPISVRWARYQQKCLSSSLPKPTLEQFVLQLDENLYSGTSGLATLASRAQIKLLNSTSSLKTLHAALDALNLLDPSRLRPTWDQYFMTLASLAARRSNCMRRQVGCVLVRNNRILSTGYNGTPRHITNCAEGGCPRCNGRGVSGLSGGGDLATCLCLHAEENALLEAGRERVGDGAVLYCNTCPCLTCTIKIVQVGITEVVYSQSYYMDEASAAILKEAGVQLRQFSPAREGLVDLKGLVEVKEKS